MPQVIVHVMPPSSRFGWDYYRGTHMTMAGRDLDFLHWSIAKGVEAGVPSAYQAVATLVFESREKWLQSFAESGPKLMEDFPNYTDATPVIQVTEFRASGEKI